MKWDNTNIQVLIDVKNGICSKYFAANRLQVSLKTINKRLRSYEKNGLNAFIHGNKGRAPVNKKDFDSILRIVKELGIEDSNFQTICELLELHKGIKISKTYLRNQLFDRCIISCRSTRKTRKKLKKILEEKIERKAPLSIEDKLVYRAMMEEEITGRYEHPHKPRSKYMGERIEMDASSYKWVKGLGEYNLHLAVDDATGFIVGAWIEDQETLHGYYKVMEQVLSNYGIPANIRTDKRTVFIYNKKGEGKQENDTMTQFAYAMSVLGSNLECNSDPDFKPRVERMNQTLQGKLPGYFACEKVKTIEQANQVLATKFIPWFNKKYGYNHDIQYGKYVKVPSIFTECSKEDIKMALVVITERQIDKGYCIQFNNNYYALHDNLGKQKFLTPRTSVTVIKDLEGNLYSASNDVVYALTLVPKRYSVSKEFDEPIEKKDKPNNHSIPAANHPWRNDKYLNFKSKNKQRLQKYYTA